jgi:NTP pyrophosphatase (non-canonical NTP hydrolase)
MITTQEVVDKFGQVMEYKFSIRRYHGDREAWMATDVDKLLMRLDQELNELYRAIDNYKRGEGSDGSIIMECADVANISAMISDKFGLMEKQLWLISVGDIYDSPVK